MARPTVDPTRQRIGMLRADGLTEVGVHTQSDHLHGRAVRLSVWKGDKLTEAVMGPEDALALAGMILSAVKRG